MNLERKNIGNAHHDQEVTQLVSGKIYGPFDSINAVRSPSLIKGSSCFADFDHESTNVHKHRIADLEAVSHCQKASRDSGGSKDAEGGTIFC